MAKSKNLGLAKLRSTSVNTYSNDGKIERAVALPPSPTSTCTIGPSSPQETDADPMDQWSVQSYTPTEPKPPGECDSRPLQPTQDLEFPPTVEGTTMPAEVLAIAQLQASMKEALQGLANVMDHVGRQSVLMTQLTAQIKERGELSTLHGELQQQIASQREELYNLKTGLESRIKQTAEDTIKTELKAIVNESIANIVEERVRRELSIQVPVSLRQSSADHERQIHEVQTELFNSEARRYNASLKSASLDAPLRPLLRPVPTPEQSPYPVLVTSATDSSVPASSLPFADHLRLPLALPMRRTPSTRSTSTAPSAISRSQSVQMTAGTPSASALFPKDLKSLFALDSGSARTLLKEYGLRSSAPSPVTEGHTSLRPSHIPESPATRKPPSPVEEGSESEDDVKTHMEDMNAFMSHIGVPFKMVPPPRTKETNAERRKKLAPLIISNWTGPR
ncbi:hypothetical protein NMY22_g6224 [Coprinellus aureogranulatus]|nr:hypothetical protein NMY22_g6224 [Coprinellus aureogranulatus]